MYPRHGVSSPASRSTGEKVGKPIGIKHVRVKQVSIVHLPSLPTSTVQPSPMHFFSFLLLVSVFATKSAACPGKSKYGFIPPKPTDLRGPCPALNALSNHGYLPRNGQNLTIRNVLQASLDVYNIDPAVLTGVAKLGLLTSNEPESFTLDDIKLHGTIEFDASLSRGDFALGDNTHFNETIFSTLANSNPGVDYYNVTSAGRVQFERLAESERTNPNITNTDKEIGFRSFTSALYLAVFGNVTTGVAPKNFVQIWFREERLPYAEGWQRPECVLDGASVTALTGAVKTASDWTSSGGCPYVRTGPSDAPTLDSKAICKQLDSLTGH
ncbi:Peroxidase, family 2-domain-containing protein [Mycena leptocephala]|nr:Peroxidase, family 2-domain-containing protein [Mycena leptocephala]